MEDETIVLYDENGEEQQFELIASLTVEDKDYVVVRPIEDEDSEDGYILRVDKDNNGEDIFVGVEDDSEFDTVVEAYNELMDEYDDDDEDYDEFFDDEDDDDEDDDFDDLDDDNDED